MTSSFMLSTVTLVLVIGMGCNQNAFDDAFWESEIEALPIGELSREERFHDQHDPSCAFDPVPGFVKWKSDGAEIVFDYVDYYERTSQGLRFRELSGKASLRTVDSNGEALRTLAEGSPAPEFRWPLAPNMYADFFTAGSNFVYSTCSFRNPHLLDKVLEPCAGCVQEPPYSYELAISRLDGSKTKRLTVDGGYDNFPVLSPENTEIAFLSSRYWYNRAGRKLSLMRVDGSNRREVPLHGLHLSIVPPSWSPDGKKLAFVALEDPDDVHGARAIYTVDVESSEVTRVSLALGGPAWSPDGRRIALAKYDGDDVALFSAKPDGSDFRFIATITDRTSFEHREGRYFFYGRDYFLAAPGVRGPWIHVLSWSPSGDLILFSCAEGVCIVDTDGDLIGTSVEGVHGFDKPSASWSPDGLRVAVKRTVSAKPRDGSVVLYTMKPDGSDMRVLVRDGSEGQPVAARLYRTSPIGVRE